MDVQIEFLCGTLGTTTENACVPGIAQLLAQAENQRERLQPRVVKAVDGLEASDALGEMQAATKKVLASPEAEGVATSDFAFDQTKQFILRQLEEMLRVQSSLDDPSDYRHHHAVRIAAKRLRYTLEISKPVYGAQLDEFVEATKRVQSLLGDVHDCDVWLRHIEGFAQRERERLEKRFGAAGRFERLKPGIDALLRDRGSRRGEVFQESVDYWRGLKRDGVWDRLVRLVEGRGRPASVPEPAGPSAEPVADVAGPAEKTPAVAPTASPDQPARRAKSNGSSPGHPVARAAGRPVLASDAGP